MTPRAVAGPCGGELDGLIARFTTSGPVTDRNPNGTIFEGSASSPSISTSDEGFMRVRQALPEGFIELERLCDHPYRLIWGHLEMRATVTYVEGDVSVFVAHDAASWDESLTGMQAFYDSLRTEPDDHPRHGQVSAYLGIYRVSFIYGPDRGGFYTVEYADATRPERNGEQAVRVHRSFLS